MRTVQEEGETKDAPSERIAVYGHAGQAVSRTNDVKSSRILPDSSVDACRAVMGGVKADFASWSGQSKATVRSGVEE